MRSQQAVASLCILVLSRTTTTAADTICADPPHCHIMGADWTRLWYVWLILMVISVVLVFGILVSCIKFCCKTNKPSAFSGHPFEVTVISVDNESTVQSTSTLSSAYGPSHGSRPSLSYRVEMGNNSSPPPYNLYALENPPEYEEALKMPVNDHAILPGVRKADSSANETISTEAQEEPLSEEDMNMRNQEQQDLENPPEAQADSAEEEPPQYELYDTIGEHPEEEFSDIELDDTDSIHSHEVEII
ncbi:transmembrane protein 52 [Amia ocellicauda]|uniref:transmembrane protein 52 n=1 Tax=Amia ocellicauda TaxID=2972642 RepID=UPI003464473A